MILSPEALRTWMERNFPRDATCWSQATDEPRDMSRCARELANLGDEYAINFRDLKTPAEWNCAGIDKTIEFYTKLNMIEREAFCAQFQHWLVQTKLA